jgi:hypothetical protein
MHVKENRNIPVRSIYLFKHLWLCPIADLIACRLFFLADQRQYIFVIILYRLSYLLLPAISPYCEWKQTLEQLEREAHVVSIQILHLEKGGQYK